MAFSFTTSAQRPFTAGNIVVSRVGDGSVLLGGDAAPVYLDEYTPAGVLVQSILMPTAMSGTNHPLTVQGSDLLTAALTLSTDGKSLLLGGLDLPVGPVVNPLNPATIGIVDFNGKANTATSITDYVEGNGVPRTAKSDDGNRIWFGGGGAIRYTIAGSSTSTLIATPTNTYNLAIEGGQLYAGVSTGARIMRVGTGLPVTGPQTLTALPGLPTGTQTGGQFAFADLNPSVPGVDVLYAASPSSAVAATIGIRKFSLVNNAWVDNGSVGGTVANSFYTGLAIKVSGSTVTVFSTRLGSNASNIRGGELVSIVDNSGYNSTFTGTPVVIASVAVTDNMAFRSIALVPQACKALSSVSAINVTASQATISWTPIAGVTDYEYIITTDPVPPAANATGIAVTGSTVSISGLTNDVTYYIYVRSVCGAAAKSDWVSTSFTTVCQTPSVPGITISISPTGVTTIRWNKVFGASEYEYFVSNSAVSPVSGTATTDTFFTVTGLNAVSDYYVHIRSVCGTGVFSGWVNKLFSTSCLSPVLSVNVTHNDAVVSWNRINNVNKYEYALTHTPARPLSGTYTTDTAYSINNLNDGSANYFHVRSVCSTGALSEWSTIDFVIQGLQVWPNPVRGTLNIRLNSTTTANKRINITDATGKVIKQLSFAGNTATIDMSGWAPGMYILNYDDNQGTYRVKLLKE